VTTVKSQFLVVAAAMMMAASLAQGQNADQNKPAAAPPSQSAAAPASSSAPKAAAPSKPAAARSAAASTPITKPDPEAQLIRDARNAGFKPEMIRGTRMFCRTAVELGSSFPVRTCYGEDDVKLKIQEYQTERNQLQQLHNTGLMTH
jgi:hypothetical protein